MKVLLECADHAFKLFPVRNTFICGNAEILSIFYPWLAINLMTQVATKNTLVDKIQVKTVAQTAATTINIICLLVSINDF